MDTHKIDLLLQEACAQGAVAGAVAMVTTRTGLAYQGSCGRRDASAAPPMTSDTVFWIASMTKAITSALCLQLVERGLLSLHLPVADIVPALGRVQVIEGFDATGQPRLRAARAPITLHHLLCHTSGYGYEYWSEPLQRLRKSGVLPPIATCRNAALEAPLLCDPGERWEYGIGIDWAGKIAEAALGMRLGAALHETLFEPLGMRDTAFRIRPALRERLARVHQRGADGTLAPLSMEVPQEPEFEMGGGGLYSTSADYLRFARMLLNGGELDGRRVLAPATVSAMTSDRIGPLRVTALRTAAPRVSNDVEFLPEVEKGFGYGFLVTRQTAASGLPAGSLVWAGFANTYYWIDPAQGLAAVLLAQVVPFADARVLELFTGLQRAVYGASR